MVKKTTEITPTDRTMTDSKPGRSRSESSPRQQQRAYRHVTRVPSRPTSPETRSQPKSRCPATRTARTATPATKVRPSFCVITQKKFFCVITLKNGPLRKKWALDGSKVPQEGTMGSLTQVDFWVSIRWLRIKGTICSGDQCHDCCTGCGSKDCN